MTPAIASLTALHNGASRGKVVSEFPRYMLAGAELYDAYSDELNKVVGYYPVDSTAPDEIKLVFRTCKVKRQSGGWWAKVVSKEEYENAPDHPQLRR